MSFLRYVNMVYDPLSYLEFFGSRVAFFVDNGIWGSCFPQTSRLLSQAAARA